MVGFLKAFHTDVLNASKLSGSYISKLSPLQTDGQLAIELLERRQVEKFSSEVPYHSETCS